MENVRVRIAPSPTGMVHVGNTHAAYFNYVFAKKNNGTFIVRLDDTDAQRFVEGAEEKVYELFTWLGLTWQEGPDIGGPYAPYRQSERFDRYAKVAQSLVDEGKAYEHEGAIFLKLPEGKPFVFNDLVRGEVSFNRADLKDLVLMRSNATPTYHFATVVDEIDHKISHVIRGEDHLSNTPKQMMIFEALGQTPPFYAHLPLLRNPDKSKLSKRQGHVSLQWYKDEGILPEALKNFFGLMGWSHPDEKEVFSEDEFVQLFNLEDLNPTAPVFDLEKLKWLNGVYIRNLSVNQLSDLLIDGGFISKDWYENREYFDRVVAVAIERMRTLSEFALQNRFFFEDLEATGEWGEKVLSLLDGDSGKAYLSDIVLVLTDESLDWNAKLLEESMRKLQEKHDLKPKNAFMGLRYIITGEKATPPLFDTMEILGREKVLKRIQTYRAMT